MDEQGIVVPVVLEPPKLKLLVLADDPFADHVPDGERQVSLKSLSVSATSRTVHNLLVSAPRDSGL